MSAPYAPGDVIADLTVRQVDRVGPDLWRVDADTPDGASVVLFYDRSRNDRTAAVS